MERVDVDGEALTAVLVDHVQELQDPPVRGLVELEVERPDDIRGDRAHYNQARPHRGLRLAQPIPHPVTASRAALPLAATSSAASSTSTNAPPAYRNRLKSDKKA